MLGLYLSVPIACWRKGAARQFFESWDVPPPATCYGALLSLVGEVEREVHVGARVTVGRLNPPMRSEVLRTLWRTKSTSKGQGIGDNVRPDFQQLIIQSELVIWLDSSEEERSLTLEDRVHEALNAPHTVSRFGGWSLGESTHLIDEAKLLPEAMAPASARTFVLAPDGEVSLPVWVDHVGSAGTRYARGQWRELTRPEALQLPRVEMPM